MAGNCSQGSCYPEEVGCNIEGCAVLTECKYYKVSEKETAKTVSPEETQLVRIPWTGNTMGLGDLNYLTATSQVILIGVSGAASAGKTTFLATLYCLLRHGVPIGDYHFSGSLTLGGWENIAWYLRWKRNSDIQFPPHTSSNAGRVPGLLHLAIRDEKGPEKHLVFTDAPGEWFDNWMVNKTDPNAQGANWIHQNSDAFLLFADCEMLAGEKRGTARKQIRYVADRIKDQLGSRPLGLVWSKSDIVIDQRAKQQITGYLNNSPIDHYLEFQTSVREGEDQQFHQNICASIEWILSVIGSNTNKGIAIGLYQPEDLFLSKR
nr:hypothetical protein [uncultured Dyadobacter sp.]